jgi:hypothetical protein
LSCDLRRKLISRTFIITFPSARGLGLPSATSGAFATGAISFCCSPRLAARSDLRPGIRILTFERRVVIAYAILPSGDIEVGRFFYGGRDYEAIIGSDRF